VDILPDGSLDLPDEFLREFDFVVASVHTRFGQDNTYRVLKAIENPYTGTALELNTFRADLSPEMVRRAVEKGVKIAIVTDAHAPSHLRYLKIGLGLARKHHVIGRDKEVCKLKKTE